MATDDYLRSALELCRKHGTPFVADEIQTGAGTYRAFSPAQAYGASSPTWFFFRPNRCLADGSLPARC